MKKLSLGVLAFGTAIMSGAVHAQENSPRTSQQISDADSIPEITVTAQKRAENLQDVPLAITAVNGDMLASRQINSIADLSTVAPNVNVGSFGGQARIAIRGIGFDTINPGSEGRVAYYIDGVYVSRPSAQLGTFFDVDRVEVLRGPQGTLYGRNATGGAISVVANQPASTVTGYTDVTYGNYNTVRLDAALSGPLTDTVDARIAVSTNSHDGYFRDTFLDEPIDDANTRAIRAIVRFHPSSEFTWTLSADFFGEGDHAYGSHYFGQSHPGDVDAGVALGGVLPTNILDINSPIEPEDNRHAYGVTSTIAYEIGDVSLKSITGYRGSDYTTITDLDNTNLSLAGPFRFFEDAHQISQEFQVLGSSGPVKWIGGLYYFDEHVFGGSQIPLNLLLFGGPDFLPNGYQVAGLTHTIAYAGFGQLDFAMTDQLSLILGARYGYERVSIDDNSEFDLATPYVEGAPINNLPGFPRADSTHSDPVTPKATLQYRATDSIDLYATASKGFKSGGFDLGVLAPAYHPESLWDYEGGIKATTFNGHLRTNLSGFYYKYTNLQESIVSGTSVLTENAAAARLYGTELEFTVVPMAQLQIDGSFTYLNSEYKQFATADPSAPQLGVQNLAGNELTQAPEFAGNLGAQYQFAIAAGGLTLRGEAIYSARVFYTPFDNPAVSTPANVKANAFLAFKSSDQHWTSTAFVRNAFNKVTIANALIASSIVGNPVEGTVSPPRTFGVMVGFHF
jgi:iron complex outermembrane recepter protein